jgi:hypothetical protein
LLGRPPFSSRRVFALTLLSSLCSLSFSVPSVVSSAYALPLTAAISASGLPLLVT